jgi:hypothetical protein
MLSFDPEDRPVEPGLSKSFRPIATNECPECAEQVRGDQPPLQTVTVHKAAAGIAQRSSVALPHEPSRDPTHLEIPQHLHSYGKRDGAFSGRMAPVSGLQSVPETQHARSHKLIEHPPTSRRQSTESTERSPLPPEKLSPSLEKSPAPSSESAKPTNGILDHADTLSQRQKLREAIGYDVQNRQWKIRKRSDLES